MSGALGPHLSGLLAPFPIITSVLALHLRPCRRRPGRPPAAELPPRLLRIRRCNRFSRDRPGSGRLLAVFLAPGTSRFESLTPMAVIAAKSLLALCVVGVSLGGRRWGMGVAGVLETSPLSPVRSCWWRSCYTACFRGPARGQGTLVEITLPERPPRRYRDRQVDQQGPRRQTGDRARRRWAAPARARATRKPPLAFFVLDAKSGGEGPTWSPIPKQ